MFPYERIKLKMQELSISNADIARATGKSTAAVSKWLSGHNVPKSENLMVLSKLLKVDSNWILKGEQQGNAFPIKAIIEEWDSDTPLDDDEVEIPYYKDFRVACGHGGTSDANSNEWRKLRFSKSTLKNKAIDPKNTAAITVYGESMSPLIADGATIFMDVSRKTVRDGKIFVIDHGGMFKIKYLYALPKGGVRVVSENSSEYPEERLTAQQIEEEEFKICGQVFSVSMMLPF